MLTPLRLFIKGKEKILEEYNSFEDLRLSVKEEEEVSLVAAHLNSTNKIYYFSGYTIFKKCKVYKVNKDSVMVLISKPDSKFIISKVSKTSFKYKLIKRSK